MSIKNRIFFMGLFVIICISILNIFLVLMTSKYNSEYNTIIRNMTNANNMNGIVQRINKEIWDIVSGNITFSEGMQIKILQEINTTVDECISSASSLDSRNKLLDIQRATVTLEEYIETLRIQIIHGNPVSDNELILKKIQRVTKTVDGLIQDFILIELKDIDNLHSMVSRDFTYQIIFSISSLTLLSLLTLLFTWSIANKISNPIMNLTKITAEMANVEFNKTDFRSKNELDVLTESFFHMRDSIEEKISDLNKEIKHRKQVELQRKDLLDALEEKNKELEQKVEERTSDLKKANEKLKKAVNEAITANKAKSEFLANMSHEIRTPLHGIIGMIELVTETYQDEAQLKMFEIINNEANILLSLINNILDFSKIEMDKIELEEVSLNIKTIIEDVVCEYAFRAEQEGLEIIPYISPNIPSYLLGDPTRLIQVLMNLTNNAVKFTHEGEILVKAELLESDNKSCRILFEIKDTGIGIPKDKLPIILNEFSQADSSTTRKYGGTGLGTTISKQLIELMGGRLSVESTEGTGSTFSFTVSFSKQKEQEPEKSLLNISPDTPNFLLICSNSTLNNTISSYLKFWGGNVNSINEFQPGDKMISALNSPVVIIIDMDIFSSEGINFLTEMKNKYSKDIFFIGLTKLHAIKQSKDEYSEYFSQYLTKPILREELFSVIKSLFSDPYKKNKNTDINKFPEQPAASVKYPGKILLVEDYPTSQLLAKKNIESFNLTVDIAANGKEAIEAFKKDNYDLIFMDIQMPIINGFETSRLIRALENQKHGNSRIPIIAMTAHAIKGYKEKCLKCGMDEYITKPLRKKELAVIINKYLKARQIGNHNSPGEKNEINKLVSFNMNEILEDCDGDIEFILDVLKDYIEKVKDQFIIIENAIKNNDRNCVYEQAHSIKGGAKYLRALNIEKYSLELEKLSEKEDLKNCLAILNKIKNEFRMLENDFFLLSGKVL